MDGNIEFKITTKYHESLSIFLAPCYYKGNPDTSSDEFANMETRPDSRHYTFQYVIQMTEDLRELN